jgi:4-amino-4-deoxy-L-arabinose transferase-like glycosyltransferase
MATEPRNEPSPASSEAAQAPFQLLSLLAVAALLRAHQLDSALWYDEIVTLVEYVRLSPGQIVTTYTSTNNHLLYSLLAHASVETFGESAWSLRLPAAALGVASLAAFWGLAHELLPTREARLASWLVALSYHHLWFSQNARGYTGILLLTWLGTALFIRLRRGGPRWLWLPYGLSLAFGAWIHLSSLLLFAAHGLLTSAEAARERVWFGRPVDPVPFIAFAAALLGALLLYAPALPDLAATLLEQRQAGARGTSIDTWKNPVWTAIEIARGLPIGPASLLVVTAGAAAAATGLASLLRHQPFGAFVLILPGVLTLTVLLAVGFNIWPRYFLVSLGFASLLGVHGIFVGTRHLLGNRGGPATPERARRTATAICLTVTVLSAATMRVNYRLPKQDHPGALALVREQNRNGAPVWTAGLANYTFGRYYEPGWPAIESVEELETRMAGTTDCWVLYAFPTHLAGTQPELFARLEQDFQKVGHFPGTLRGGDIYVLRRAVRRGE